MSHHLVPRGSLLHDLHCCGGQPENAPAPFAPPLRREAAEVLLLRPRAGAPDLLEPGVTVCGMLGFLRMRAEASSILNPGA